MNTDLVTATFLFTDLENSTALWERHPGAMQALSSQHDALLRHAIEANRGRVVKTTGDGFHAVFDHAADGVTAALAAQQAILAAEWPAETGAPRVRQGLHTGQSRFREGDYYGAEVNRAARVMDVAHGGQILLSEATAALVRNGLPDHASLAPLGRHRLRGLAAEELLSQLCHPDLPAAFPPLKSLSVYKHNLRVQLSTFVGRRQELEEVKRLLKGTHLLTLLGPGGTGKTRLMLEAAEEVIGDFRDGVWLVELAPLNDPDLIPERVAAALKVQEQRDRSLLESIVDFLRHKELLLLLDNVEHLVGECADLAERLLTQCPGLKILVTGREALFIPGELTLQIPSLSLPTGNGSATMEQIQASEGVQLFVTRAQEVQPSFELGPSSGPTIAEIVRRLDGIPLALELAAARLSMLSVDQIAQRLNDRFRLLTGGRRTALARQQTLKALIDWSWQLLDAKEQTLLCRLSVFSGGWSLDAAESVASDASLDAYDIFDLLQQLVNKSLVTVSTPESGEARYNMLESIRQYGRDRLFESEEGEQLRDRNAAYFVAFAEEAAPHLPRATMLPWTDRIIRELDNLRAVLAWTLEDKPELSLRIVASLLRYEVHWLTPREAQSWLEPAVEKTRPLLNQEGAKVRQADFIKALIGLGIAYGWQGDHESSVAMLKEGAALAQEIGDRQLQAHAMTLKYVGDHFNLSPEAMQELDAAVEMTREEGAEVEHVYALGMKGMALRGQGELAQAYPLFLEAIKIAEKLDNPHTNASMYAVHARLAEFQGDFAAAEELWLLAIENLQALNSRRGVLTGHSHLAHMLRRQGRLDEAEAYYRLSIVGWQEIGQPAAVAHQIECFAYLAIARGEPEPAARLIGAATEARQQLNALSRDPEEIADLETAMADLAQAMGLEARDAAVAAGGRMSLDEAVRMVLAQER